MGGTVWKPVTPWYFTITYSIVDPCRNILWIIPPAATLVILVMFYPSTLVLMK